MEMSRHYGMDWLRIGAFGLLIFYHVGMFFVPWDWHVKTDRPIDWATIPMLALNAWRIPLLFVVSGYATRMVLAKSGGSFSFVRDRSARLLIPLLFAIAVIVPPQPWAELSFKHGYGESYGTFLLNDYFRFGTMEGILLPTWQHLWFVVYLWTYTMLLSLVAAVLPASVKNRLGRVAESFLRGAGLFLLPIGWLALMKIVLLSGTEETYALIGDWAAHGVYIPHFFFGFVLADAPQVWATIRDRWSLSLIGAVFAFLICAALEYNYPGDTPAPDGIGMVFTVARLVQGWCAVIALLGIADRFWNHDAPVRAKLTEGVFPFYIIHQTIIVLVGWWLLQLELAPAVEFGILVAATAVGCSVFYELGRRHNALRPLIGLKARARKGPSPLASRSVSRLALLNREP